MNCGYALPASPGAPPAASGSPGAAVPPSPPPASPPPAAGYPPAYPPPAAPYGAPYAQPYAPPPKPAGFSEMLSDSFHVWSQNFAPLFAVYLLYGLVVAGLSVLAAFALYGVPYPGGAIPLFSTGATPSANDIGLLLAYELVIVLIGWIVGSAVIGGVTDFAVRRHRGETPGILDSLKRGFQRVLSIMGANLLVTIIVSGVLILWAVVIVAGAVDLVAGGVSAGAIALICGGLLALPFVAVLVIYLYLALSLYTPAIMMEGAHAVDSLGRSWALSKGHKWSLFGAIIIMGILYLIVSAAISAVGAIGGNWVAESIAGAIVAAIAGSWFTILFAVAYDLIVRAPQPTVWPPTYTPAYPPR